MCVVSGAANGFRNSAGFIFGLNVSYSGYSLLAGFGLGAFIRKYPQAFFYVQLLGCAYMFYLGASFFWRRADKPGGAPKLTFRDGLVSQALNIKGVSIVVLMHSQFLSPESPVVPQVLLLTAMLTMLNLCNHFSWAFCGAWTAGKFSGAASVRIQNAVYGAMLIVVAVWLLPVWK